MYVYLKIIVICHIFISVFAKVGKVRVSFDCDCDAVPTGNATKLCAIPFFVVLRFTTAEN